MLLGCFEIADVQHSRKTEHTAGRCAVEVAVAKRWLVHLPGVVCHVWVIPAVSSGTTQQRLPLPNAHSLLLTDTSVATW